jgi:hypothetical protein
MKGYSDIRHAALFKCLLVFKIISGTGALPALDTLSMNKALNIPFRRFGISIVNSKEFNGIRFNVRENEVRLINRLNLTLWKPCDYGRNEVVMVFQLQL